MENSNKGLAIVPQLAQMDNIGFAKDLISNIKEGTVEPIMVHLFLKRIEAIQKTLKSDKEVQEIILNEAAKHAYDGKTFQYLGAKISIAATHTDYDYKDCNDPMWTSLAEIEATVKALKKDRETFLQAAFPKTETLGFKAPSIIVDTVYSLVAMDCGEEVRLNKPVKWQTSGLKVTFPK